MSDKYPGGFVTANAPAGFSVAFDGTGDYFTAADNANLDLGSGDFTIEGWINTTVSNGGYVTAVSKWGSSNQSYMVRAASTDIGAGWSFFYSTNGSNYFTVFGSSVNDGAWHHIAVTRSGNVFRTFTDGVLKNSTTDAVTLYDGTSSVTIGAGDAGANPFTGYLSNVRIVKGTALYTAAFTPPTQLFPVTNTQLLVCQSPTIIDNSSNAFTLTVAGNTVVSNFTPFAAYQGFNPALGAAAGGVWTLDEAAYYQQNRLWPIYDPYFNQTTLMLHGNGTNGAQNNTFLDSSTNNFTITRAGNTTQGTFTPFSQTGWSNYFNGSGSLSTGTSTSLAFGTGDFTIEFWVNLVSYNGTYTSLFSTRTPSDAGGNGLDIQIFLTGGNYQLMIGNPVGAIISANNVTSLNTWMHVAATRVSSVLYLFVNGAQVATGASAYNFSVGNAYWGAGAGGTNNSVCYISNLRVIKGTGLYASSFTPSTQPLASVTNTVLLSAQSNRFVDNSANNFTLTVNGSGTTIQAFSPFVPAYITPTTYSNRFDGTGDYLTLASNAAFTFGTGDFTIEAWVYNTNSSTGRFVLYSTNSPGTSGGLTIFQESTSLIYFRIDGGNDLTTTAPSINAWNHIAVTRASGTVRIFVNGILNTSATRAQDVTQNTPYIGDFPTGSYSLNGCMSNLRVLKGTALYTAAFTPPTAPLTNITNTSLLTCQSSTFIDNSTNAFTITATGNVQPVTSPTPFPANVDTTTLNSAYSTSLIGGSGYFDGTGDYLTYTTPSSVVRDWWVNDFTLEAWIYPTTLTGWDYLDVVNRLPSAIGNASATNTNNFWSFGPINTGAVRLYYYNGAAVLVTSTETVKVNQWNHIAFTKNSAGIRIFVNGVGTTATAVSGTPQSGNTYPLIVGQINSASCNGYIAGTRIVNGTALYTSSFAPPITPPTAVTNTSFLLNYTNGAIFDNTAKNVLETVGNAQISTTQSKWGGSSISFDGTGDYLVSNSGTDLYAFGSGNFTIECWVYFNTVASQVFYDGRPSGVQTTQPSIYMSGAGVLFYYANGANVITGATLTSGQWYHIAVSRSGTSTKMFLNGVQTGSTYSDTTVYTNTAGRPIIGVDGFSPPSNPLNGYVDDMRVTKGVARYITNFTPPTSQLQDQ